MSKSLELTIYPHHPKHLNTNWLTMYVTPDGPMAAGRGGVLPAAKHFTDAQLAAEVWRETDEYTRTAGQVLYQRGALENGHLLNHFKETERRGHTLTRFATTPHYFEVDE